MQSDWYSISWLISAGVLCLWFVLQSKRPFSSALILMLLGALAAYLYQVFNSATSVQAAFSKSFVDILWLGVTSLAAQFFKKNRLWPGIIIVGIASAYAWWMLRGPGNKISIAQPIEQSSGITFDKQGELLLELVGKEPNQALLDLMNQYDLDWKPAFTLQHEEATELDNYILINIPAKNESRYPEILDALQQTDGVTWVEGNEVIHVADPVVQRPPVVRNKFGINDPGLEQLWGFEAMEMHKLYDVLKNEKPKPRKKARIFILDTGVDAQHEDIKDNYRSVKRDYDTDPQKHGTHCAGIAAAVSNNGVGVASFSFDNSMVQVSSVKVLNQFGFGNQQTIIQGMLEAADNGADVISMSLGGRSDQAKQRAYEKAVAYAQKTSGAIVIVAAGNSADNASGYGPANVPGLIAVSAVDQQLNKAAFSNTVQDLKMAVAAPGVAIYSTIPGNQYAAFNGTSMAAPYVSGLAGLMKSLDPTLDAKRLFEILNATGKATQQSDLTGKLINPGEAVKRLLE